MKRDENWQLQEWLRTEGLNGADVVPAYSLRDELAAVGNAFARLGSKVRSLVTRREPGEVIVLERPAARRAA